MNTLNNFEASATKMINSESFGTTGLGVDPMSFQFYIKLISNSWL